MAKVELNGWSSIVLQALMVVFLGWGGLTLVSLSVAEARNHEKLIAIDGRLDRIEVSLGIPIFKQAD